MAKKNKIKDSWDDKIMYLIVGILLTVILIAVLYPMVYVVSCSVSDGIAVGSGKVVLWPVGFTLDGYRLVFQQKNVWIGFKNSAIYVICGTTFSMFLTILCAYPLSRPNYQFRGFLVMLYTITMLFGAGLIPKYLLLSKLGLIDTRWALILPGALGTYNMILVRTYFRHSVPNELIEAAAIDGCSDLRTLWKIVLPLAKSVISVVSLYYAVGNWNMYMAAIIYTRKPALAPLQVVLRQLLDAANVDLSEITDTKLIAAAINATSQIKYAMIVVTSVPVIAMYPLVQKYFQKGIMIGSVKG